MPTILVIEDDIPMQHLIRQRFSAAGFQVEGARSADEALANLFIHAVDIIWLDHYLLGQDDGLVFIDKLKINPAWRGLPIYVVSGGDEPAQVSSYQHRGVRTFFSKSEHSIEQIVEQILADSTAHRPSSH